jgi:arginyl-tRNA synthetase
MKESSICIAKKTLTPRLVDKYVQKSRSSGEFIQEGLRGKRFQVTTATTSHNPNQPLHLGHR